MKHVLERYKQTSRLLVQRQRERLQSRNNNIPDRVANSSSPFQDEGNSESVPLLTTTTTSSMQNQTSSSSQATLYQQSQLQIVDTQVDFNEALIYERDSEIQDIQTSIGQVNEIFRDLGTLVHHQGHLLGMMSSFCSL